jgi:hypothetical protein
MLQNRSGIANFGSSKTKIQRDFSQYEIRNYKLDMYVFLNKYVLCFSSHF